MKTDGARSPHPGGMSPRVVPYGGSPMEDHSMLMLTPTENYRCPVSTPSNYTQGRGRPRRTRPLLEDIYSQPTTQRSNKSHQPAMTKGGRKGVPRVGYSPAKSTALDYYCVDKSGDSREAALTNTHWLRALVSQPVDEILGKYRRKTDLKRTHIIWSKTFSTPGERRLMTAWKCNSTSGRGTGALSAQVGGRTRASATSRMARSEPALSRAHHPSDHHHGNHHYHDHLDSRHDCITPSISTPRRSVNAPSIPSHAPSPCASPEPPSEPPRESPVGRRGKIGSSKSTMSLGSMGSTKAGVRGHHLLDTAGETDSRISQYTTKTYRKIDPAGQEKVFSRVSWGPEQLLTVPTGRKVASMLYNNPLHRGAGQPGVTCGPLDDGSGDGGSSSSRQRL